MTAVVDYDPALWDAEKLSAKLSEESEGFFTATVVE